MTHFGDCQHTPLVNDGFALSTTRGVERNEDGSFAGHGIVQPRLSHVLLQKLLLNERRKPDADGLEARVLPENHQQL